MMDDIGKWLQRNGLGRYVDAFAENEVDLDALPHLTEDDLKEMGVALGPRRKLLAAIAALEAASEPTSPDEDTELISSTSEAERRQLTVLFVDLVGSTALSGQLDPEDMREVITSYQNLVAGVVTRFDGHIAKYMGDGVLCYFGWPRAHEDDAERAVRSAMAATQSLRGMAAPNGQMLSARAGIATGLVVVGDLIGEGAAQEEAVVGETPNLAARMQGLAKPNQVVIAELTRQLLGNLFELADLGGHELKGISGSTPAYAVIAERAVESRFEARSSGSVSEMVGRNHELALILERWRRASEGEGQLLLLTGEAGIGKSRITRATIDAVKCEPHVRISYQCSAYHTDSSLYPAIQQLTFAADIKDTDSNDEKLDKLEAVLLNGSVALIATLMGLEAQDRYGPLDMTPQQQRTRTLQALVRELIALSRDKPVLLILEDAHWIDASTLEFLDLCLDQITSVPVLMLITARPTFEYGFGGHPIVSKLALNRLGRDQVTAIVDRITGGKVLPAELLEEIAAKTDGVPLFVEELTKTVLESGELREIEAAYELKGPLSRLAIPATLHDSLMARLDRLQPIKEVAQTAACIGRQFEYPLIESISPLDDMALQDALEQLVGAELIFRRGVVPEATYTFKHALVRDAAYESLLKSRRQAIHAKLVDALEADGKAPPELIAHHATEAGLKEQAVELWQRAGTTAMAQPAYEEAASHLNSAIDLIARMDNPEAWRERELELLVQLAQILIAKFGYVSEAANKTFKRAAAMIDVTRNMELRVAIYYGMWIGPYLRAEHEACLELTAGFVDEVDRQDADIPRIIAHRMRSATLIALGRPTEALDHLKVSFSLYEQDRTSAFASRFAQEPGVQIKCYQLLALWMTGQVDQALAVAAQATATARELRHANTICYAALHHGVLAMFCRDDELLKPINDEGLSVATEHGMSLWITWGAFGDELLKSRMGDEAAMDRLEAALDDFTSKGVRLWMTFYKAEQAKEFLRLGQITQASDAVQSGLKYVATTGERWTEAELYRVEGEVHLARSKPEDADASFERALDIARGQGARSLELRAAISRARLWGERGERSKASDLLQPLYEWFTEGFDTPDLKDARELLDDLD